MSSRKPVKSTERPDRSARRDADNPGQGINDRLAQVRERSAGKRGRSRFARQLGLTPSTYGNYEKDRTPPPDVLVRVADLTGTDLVWLLTGRGSPDRQSGTPSPAVDAAPEHRAILQRAAELLADRPANLRALAAFLDLLEEKARVESDRTGDSAPALRADKSSADRQRWIPIFGRAAAGLARFWDELQAGGDDVDPAEALDRMIAEAARIGDAESRLAVLEPQPAKASSGRRKTNGDSDTHQGGDVHVRLLQLPEPLSEYQVTELLETPGWGDRYRPLFGLRISGDSMEPMLPDGAIVLACPNEPARPGRAAIVRLAGQIGITCKLYRPVGDHVRLVPVNDAHPAREFPADRIEWALAVLACVRIG